MPLLSSNRFSCLDIKEISDKTLDQQILQDILKQPMEKLQTLLPQLPTWEKKLPKKLTIVATPSSHSFNLKVEIQTTDTPEMMIVTMLLDSSATGLFLDMDYVKEQKLSTRKLTHPIPVVNVDGTPNEAGPIRVFQRPST